MTYSLDEIEHAYTKAIRLRANLGSLAKVAGARCEPRELAALVAAEAVTSLGAAACVVTTFADAGDPAPFVVCNPKGLDPGEVVRASRRLARGVAAAGVTLTLAADGEDDARGGLGRYDWSYLGVPLRSPAGEALGVACVFGEASRRFNEEDGWWLEAAARTLADALYARGLEERLCGSESWPTPEVVNEPFGGAAGGQTGRALSFLVVDDDRAVNDLLCEFIKMEGHHAEPAFDGLDAARRFRAAEHDVVITDVAMPLMNGWELIAELRAKAPGLPVVLITGYGSGNWNEGFLQRHGVRALLHKPLDTAQFTRTVRELLEEIVGRAA